MIPKTDEFYVGYIPNAPSQTAHFIRWVVVAFGFIVVATSVILVLHQRNFSTANFEYGVPTTIGGYVFTEPVPHLKQPLGEDLNGRTLYQTILLVGFGKSGANAVLQNIKKNSPGAVDGKWITLNGFLIYGDGKTLLQVTEEDNHQVSVEPSAKEFPLVNFKTYGTVNITGEVVDPKCYFGVMKPGEGKPHRSCAIRCIAGGIPPVFKSIQTAEYFLLAGENLEPLNEEVLCIVGDRINLAGELVQMEDWKILKVNAEELSRLSRSKALQRNVVAMEVGMTICR